MRSPIVKALTGAEAAAEAMRQINPEVVPVYPITPQTQIVEKFSEFVSDGLVDGAIINVESEHSAMSATIGAAAAGVRAMTATSSAGLALMYEMLGIASGLRLPILTNIANRTLSAPLNIHCDHSDSMGVRDAGWIQIYSENAQEVYDHNLIALRVAEKVKLPAFVMQDGYITSHSLERVEVLNDDVVKEYIGTFAPDYPMLDVSRPVTVGALQLPDYYFETKRQHIEAMAEAVPAYAEAAKDMEKLTGRNYPAIETYGLDGAETAIIVLSSTAGTAKAVADALKEEKGIKVGVIKPRLFLPFPREDLREAVKGLTSIAVLDRAVSIGSDAPLYKEIRNALFTLPKRPKLQSYIFGLGGREIFEENIRHVYDELLKGSLSEDEVLYIGLRE